MGSSDKIELMAANVVERLFLDPNDRFLPEFKTRDKNRLFDGCIFFFKNNDITNENIIDKIDVQIKGKTQKGEKFNDTVTYGVKKALLKVARLNWGCIFFVVRLVLPNFRPRKVYFAFLTSESIEKLLGEMLDKNKESIELNEWIGIEHFTAEFEKFLENKQGHIKILMSRVPDTHDIDKIESGKAWLKTIYYHGKKFCEKHPLYTVYSELKEKINTIILVGEPRLGKSYEMKSLFEELKKKNAIFTRFFDLSQYRSDDLVSKLRLDDKYAQYEIILDGYDEISAYHLEAFNRQIKEVVEKFERAKIIISTRENSKQNIPVIDIKSGFNTEINLVSTDILDLLKSDDEDREKFLSLESDYLRELFLIPIYRPIINDLDRKRSIYDALIDSALEQNREKIDNKRGSSALASDEIIKTQLTAIAREIQAKDSFLIARPKGENLLFETDFFKSYDGENFTFSNKTYHDYFVALYYLKADKEETLSFFFVNNKLKVATIDIFVIFFDLIRYKNKELYNEIFEILKRMSFEAILLTDFSSYSAIERYEYFEYIFEERSRNNNIIYHFRYSQSQPVFGILKNVQSMAMRMQILIPESMRNDAFNKLFSVVSRYMDSPCDDEAVKFVNSVILINPSIDNLWKPGQQEKIKEISAKIIRFLLFNKQPEQIKYVLSIYMILNWYRHYQWTKDWKKDDWELFIREISGIDNKLNSRIYSDKEFALKSTIYSYFYDNESTVPMLAPLLYHVLNKADPSYNEAMEPVQEVNIYNNADSVMQIEYSVSGFYDTLIKVRIPFKLIIEALEYASIRKLLDEFDGLRNPIRQLEEQLIQRLNELTPEFFDSFSDFLLKFNYYHEIKKYFEKMKAAYFDDFKLFLIEKIYIERNNISRHLIEELLSELLNLTDSSAGESKLSEIKARFSGEESKGVYEGIIYCIYRNENHILKLSKLVDEDYYLLFAEQISAEERQRQKRLVTEQKIKEMYQNELNLILDNSAMVNEIKNIIVYINEPENLKESNTLIGKIHLLGHEHILLLLDFYRVQIDEAPNIFSKTALFIVENYIRSNRNTKVLNEKEVLSFFVCLHSKAFFIYFYWIYIEQDRTEDANKEVIKLINENPEIKQKILNSLDETAKQNFKRDAVSDFDGSDNCEWVTPFIFYLKNLLHGNIPVWLEKDDILKLCFYTNPYRAYVLMGYNVNLSWFEELFSSVVTRTDIVEFCLDNISLAKNDISIIQVTNVFIDFYHSERSNNLADKIISYFIKQTRILFGPRDSDDRQATFSQISVFWSRCEENFADELFPNFSINIILYCFPKDDNKAVTYYRKAVLEYIIRIIDNSQKDRIIQDIITDVGNKNVNALESHVITQFLASLGHEESVNSILDGYLKGDDIIVQDIFSGSSLGVIKKSDCLLEKYIKVLFYCTNKSEDQSNIRKTNFIYLAREGIKQHLTKNNFNSFEAMITNQINTLRENCQYTGFYEELLLEMEQYVFKI